MTTQPYPWQLDPPQVGDLCWCIHHNPAAGQAPLEILTEPLENRVEYIRLSKPLDEIEIRLRAFRKARGPFTPEIDRVRIAWDQAAAACDQAAAAWDQAAAAWKQAYAAWEQADAARAQADAACEQAAAAWEQAVAACEQADAAWDQAAAARAQAHAECEQSHAAWEQALDEHAAELMRFFRAECADVAWDENGLVFP